MCKDTEGSTLGVIEWQKLLGGLNPPPFFFLLSTTAHRSSQSAESDPRDCFEAVPPSNVNERGGHLINGQFPVILGRSHDCPHVHKVVTHTCLQLYSITCEYTQCVDTYSMPPCILLSFQKDFRSRPCSAILLYPSQKKNREKTQLKLVLMEAIALHYSELSLWP